MPSKGCATSLARGAGLMAVLVLGGVIGCGPESERHVEPAPKSVHEGDGCLFLGTKVERDHVVLTCTRSPGEETATWKRAQVP